MEALDRNGWIGSNDDKVCLPRWVCADALMVRCLWLHYERIVAVQEGMGGVNDCSCEIFRMGMLGACLIVIMMIEMLVGCVGVCMCVLL